MNDIIDINVTPTIETIAITVEPNLTTVNVNTVQQSSDNSAVKLTTNQTIDGVKTFVQSPIVPTATTANQAVNLGQVITYTGTTQPITGYLEFGETSSLRGLNQDYCISFESDITRVGAFNIVDYEQKVGGLISTSASGVDVSAMDETGVNTSSIYISKTINTGIVVSDGISGIGLTGAEDFSANITDLGYTQKIYVDNAIASGVSGAELLANKNQNNGYSGLDSGGKIPLANLPTTLLKYQGVWNASTNTPTLTNPDTTKIGNVYNVSVAGTRFGIDFKLGDWLIYNASGIPEKSDNSDDVVSVNGQTGVVTITKSDVGLSNVDNTSDVNKPVSTAQQTALDSKLTKSGDTITGDILNTSTGFIEAPSGTTAQRPGSPRNRMFRYNTDTLRFEFYANGAWRNMARLEGDTFTGAISATNLSGTNTGDIDEDNVYGFHDFLTTFSNESFALVALNSGTLNANANNVTVNNAGIARVTSSTTANSGFAIRGSGATRVLKGGEVTNLILNPLTFANTTLRDGIHDSTTSTAPNNGVYFEYSGSGVLSIVTANNGTRTTTTVTTLVVNTWYKLRITVNINATSVLAEVFDNAGVLITSQTVTTNIPDNTRIINRGVIVSNSTTTSTNLVDVDFISVKTTLTR